MLNTQLQGWMDNLITIQELQEKVYDGLSNLPDSTWQASIYRTTTGIENAYTNADRPLVDVDQLIQTSDTTDLVAIQTMSEREENSRRGLALLEASLSTLEFQAGVIRQQLRRIQAVRDAVPFEMERRSRIKMLADGGEHLSSFVSRFMFGPAPTPLANGNTPESPTFPRNFFIAKVKSGKKVYVEHLEFMIPSCYHTKVLEALRNEEAIPLYTSYVPTQADPKIACIYYKLGFKPLSKTIINYQLYFQTYGISKWILYHTRMVKTTELEPVE